jgi:hypothetical protein
MFGLVRDVQIKGRARAARAISPLLRFIKMPPHTDGVWLFVFHVVFFVFLTFQQPNATCMRRLFYEPERKKIVFSELKQ